MTSRHQTPLATLAVALVMATGFTGVARVAAGQGAAPAKELALSPTAKGVHGAAKSASGLAYEFFIPAAFDAKAGANLVFILHGSNLSRTWGFANHAAGTFCADAVVVCPDGTTANGNGGFNFLQGDADLKRLHELHDEVRAKLKIADTFVYGHSQGAFFAMLYAGAYPKDVRGIVAQAGGMWIGTATSKEHHHQAIVIMHGTADPVVPYGNSLGALNAYRTAAYPLVHMRALEGWNHWPDAVQAAQELAWCEGMTTSAAPRLVAAFDRLAGVKPESSDPFALHAVAKRLATFTGAPAAAVARAQATVKAVEALAQRHADAIAASAGKAKGEKLEDAAWVGHLPIFLRDFDGVPAATALAAAWKPRLTAHAEAAKGLAEFWKLRERDVPKAFAKGIEIARTAFLMEGGLPTEMTASLAEWRKQAAAKKLDAAAVKAFDDTLPVLARALEKGRSAAGLNKR